MAIFKMVRKQVYIGTEQDRRLKRKAREQGVSVSELVRRGIDLVTLYEPRNFADNQTQQHDLHFQQERERIAALGKTRGWTREDLYDRR